MKEKQNKRWGLKLLSLLCGFFVWLGVVNVADPVMTDTVEVPVEVVNGEILEKNGVTYEIIGKKTTTVSYDVKTTNAYRIRPSDFRAYADMTDLWSVTGAIPIKIEVLNNQEYLASAPVSRTSAIKIETEPLQRKKFDLRVIRDGELAEHYVEGETILSPSYLYVEGPESQVGQISSVGIEISMEGVSADFSGIAIPRYYDANGNQIELSSRLESDCEAVAYTQHILKQRELTLDFSVTGEAAEGYRFTRTVSDINRVMVVGDEDIMKTLSGIHIPTGYLHVDEARENVSVVLDVTEFLPEDVELADASQREITVTMLVEPLEERTYTIEVDESCYVGEKDEFVYRPMAGNVVSVRVRALKEELDRLTVDTDHLRIDVSSMTEGMNQTSVEVVLDDPIYEVMYVSSCILNVTRLPQETEAVSRPGMGEMDAEHPSDESPAETEQEESQDAETEESVD